MKKEIFQPADRRQEGFIPLSRVNKFTVSDYPFFRPTCPHETREVTCAAGFHQGQACRKFVKIRGD
jgi:hypothetical protein